LKTSVLLNPHERALALEASTELEAAHADAARQGDTAVPTSAEDEVDFHYVCFIKSRSGRLYEMDGGKKGPVERGIVLGDEDLLGSEALGLIREYIQREGSGNLNFSLMALTGLTEDY
jgi:ubiquitin carboxyl-terminal hydrolase L3